MISQAEQHGRYIFAIVSDTGISHSINHIHNQDSVNFCIIDSDFVLAVSDGVGSCTKAARGSRAAVSAGELVFRTIKQENNLLGLSEIARYVISEWNAQLSNENVNECCATLKSVFKIGNKMQLLSVGDGMLVITSGTRKKCAPIENDLFANQTNCLHAHVLTTDFWLSEFYIDEDIPFAVFMCTDGVANVIQEGREIELVKEIENEIAASELQGELESLLRGASKYCPDDRTVGVVKYECSNARSKW